MLAALILGHALAFGPPPCRCECRCPQDQGQYEEVHLGGDFFTNEGGVGPAFATPIYSDTGVYIVNQGSSFGGGLAGGGRVFAGAGASASASASARASVSVRIVGGGRGGGKPSHPGGGMKGAGHGY